MRSLTLNRKDYSPHGLHKFKLYYEDVKDHPGKARRVTRADRAWNRASNFASDLVAPGRAVFRKALR